VSDRQGAIAAEVRLRAGLLETQSEIYRARFWRALRAGAKLRVLLAAAVTMLSNQADRVLGCRCVLHAKLKKVPVPEDDDPTYAEEPEDTPIGVDRLMRKWS
jgi:hypothetical protein